jgi:hypothetical protein
MEFDNYGSHICVFEKIFTTFKIKNVLEFGLGSHSTTYFAKRAQLVISVEQERRDWYDKMVARIKLPNWQPVFQADAGAVFRCFDEKNVRFELVFSDGAAHTRCSVANMAMQRNVPLVVLHDAEKVWYYQWNLLRIPVNYRRFDFRCKKSEGKVTTVLTNQNDDLVESWEVDEHERIIQAYSSPTQPVIQFKYAGDMKTSAESAKPSFLIS